MESSKQVIMHSKHVRDIKRPAGAQTAQAQTDRQPSGILSVAGGYITDVITTSTDIV